MFAVEVHTGKGKTVFSVCQENAKRSTKPDRGECRFFFLGHPFYMHPGPGLRTDFSEEEKSKEKFLTFVKISEELFRIEKGFGNLEKGFDAEKCLLKSLGRFSDECVGLEIDMQEQARSEKKELSDNRTSRPPEGIVVFRQIRN